jgi:hypothetical protein
VGISLTERSKYKLLFLMLDYQSSPWDFLYEGGAEKTWKPKGSHSFLRYHGILPDNFLQPHINRCQVSSLGLSIRKQFLKDKILMRENLASASQNDESLQIEIRDDWWRHGLKTLSAMKYVLDNLHFDFLVRGNASLYCNVDALSTFLDNNPCFYAGPLEKDKSFASGWAVVLSRRALELLLNTNLSFFYYLFDDEAIGTTLKECGIYPEKIPHYTIGSIEDTRNLNGEDLREFPFIRTKSFDISKNRIDHKIMQLIHPIIIGNP